MPRRILLIAACAALLSGAQCQAADQDTFERPNEAEECGTEPMDFLAYAEGLEFTSCGEIECVYTEQTATLFDITYKKDYKVVEYRSSPEAEVQLAPATYILYHCGQEQPNDDFIQGKVDANTSEIQYLEIPLTAVATEDSTVGWLLEELGLMDRVRFGTTFSTSPCMQKLTAAEEEDGCGMGFVGDYDEAAEPTNVTMYDANIGFSTDAATKKVYLAASQDPGPLARAEHIIYLSAFFNVEAKAITYYKKVSESYNEKTERKLAAVEDAAVPTVAWLTTHEDASINMFMNDAGEVVGAVPAAVVSFARYKTVLTRDAGGALLSQAAVVATPGAFASTDDIILAESEYASNAEFITTLQTVLKGVDVLIDETFHFDPSTVTLATLTGFLGLNGTNVSLVDFPFLANEDIWTHDKSRSPVGNDDWFGEAVARPDFVHADLEELITPGSLPNHTFKFFRNLSKGENTTISGPDECEVFTCDSYEQQAALTAGLSGEESVDVTEDSSRAGLTLVAGAVTAGAIIAAMI